MMETNNFTLTKGQADAMQKISEWFLHEKDKQVFVLAGCAGSGKSTVVSMITKELGLEDAIVYTAFTGKAVSVLTENGVTAYTMHKLMYDIDRSELPKIRFSKKIELDEDWELIVVDEASMVNKGMVADLLSFKKKVLIVGDPHQLPPIGERNQLFSSKPDIELTEIVRQAEGSPIIQLSQRILHGGSLPRGNFGHGVLICNRKQIPIELYDKADQILCGTNNTRKEINDMMRKYYHFYDHFPEDGEKLICTKNNWNICIGGMPLINGMIGRCSEVKNATDKYLLMRFKPDNANASEILRAEKCGFLGQTPPPKSDINVFDFGYCITVHKAQGSTFNTVIVIKDNMPPDIQKEWLYTAVTRPRKGLIVAV